MLWKEWEDVKGTGLRDQEGTEGRGGGAPDAEAEIPLHPLEKTLVKQVVSLQPEGGCARAEMQRAATEHSWTGAHGNQSRFAACSAGLQRTHAGWRRSSREGG